MIPETARRGGPLSLRQNFSWTLLGNVIYAACSWGMLVVLAKLGSPEAVGQFALGLAVTAPVIMFLSLQLRAVQATDAKREYQFGHYFALRLLMMALALALIAAIAFIAYPPESALIILVIGIGKAVDAISDVIYGLFQQQEQMDRISVSLIAKGLLSLLMLGAAQALTGSVLWASVGWALASIVVLVVHDLPRVRRMLRQLTSTFDLKAVYDFGILLRLAHLALPLGLAVLLDSAYANVPRYLLASTWGEANLGIFAALAYFTLAGALLIEALGQSAKPRLAHLFAVGERQGFLRLIGGMILAGTLLGALGIAGVLLVGRPFLTLAYGREYAEHVNVLVVLMIGSGLRFGFIFIGSAINAMRRFVIQFLLQIVSLVVLVLLSIFLIPPYGLYGAALALLGGSIAGGASHVFAGLLLNHYHFTNSTSSS